LLKRGHVLTVFESFILGLIQGFAEFLPISSSGHLALMENWLGFSGSEAVSVTVLLHLGTLISVLVVFRHEVWDLIKELFKLLGEIFTGKGFHLRKNDTRKLGIMIIIATIPAAIVGYLLDKKIEEVFSVIMYIGCCFIITAILLFVAERVGKGRRDLDKANFRNSLVVGLFQAVAILPGISRSGSCIVGGLLLGFTRELAVKFAFLISIPAVLGAVVLNIPTAIKEGFGGSLLLPGLFGMLVAAISGYLAIKLMLKVVTGKKLYIFSIYTMALGIATIVISIMG